MQGVTTKETAVGLRRSIWRTCVSVFSLAWSTLALIEPDGGTLGSYLSFDLMAELVFGKAFRMLEVVDNRFIIDLIQVAAFRVGVCLQLPKLATWNLDKILSPFVRRLRDQYVQVSRKMAVDRMRMESKRQDLFSHILAAKDPRTGRGFSMDEIWANLPSLLLPAPMPSPLEWLLISII